MKLVLRGNMENREKKENKCPICNRPNFETIAEQAFQNGHPQPSTRYEGKCRVCRYINVHDTAIHRVNGGGENRKHLLSAFFRQWKSDSPPEITDENVHHY